MAAVKEDLDNNPYWVSYHLRGESLRIMYCRNPKRFDLDNYMHAGRIVGMRGMLLRLV